MPVVRTIVVFGLVVSEILLSQVIVDFENPLRFVTKQPKISHIHCSWSLLFDILLTIPTALVFSTWNWMGNCAFTNSSKVSCIIFDSIVLRKRAPSSASAADAATNYRMVQLVRMAMLRRMGQSSLEGEPRKKFPPAWLHALGRGVS